MEVQAHRTISTCQDRQYTMASSSSFQRYLKEFQNGSRQVEQSIHQQQQQQDQQSNNAMDLIYQCEDSLQMMTLEARSGGSDIMSKADMLDMIKACKFRLDILKEQCERQSLLGSGCSNGYDTNTQRDRLRQQQDQVIKQNLQLENAKRTLAETEEIATSINSELGKNRETLERNQTRLKDMSSMTTNASKLLKSMKSWF